MIRRVQTCNMQRMRNASRRLYHVRKDVTPELMTDYFWELLGLNEAEFRAWAQGESDQVLLWVSKYLLTLADVMSALGVKIWVELLNTRFEVLLEVLSASKGFTPQTRVG